MDYYIYDGRIYSKSYLQHHGILGQKWGRKNGPPYPLDGSDHSASEKKAGWRKSLDSNGTSSDSKSKTSKSEESKADKTKKKESKKKENFIVKSTYDEGYKYYTEKLGYSDAEAKQLAEKRAKIIKNGLIAAGVIGGTVLVGAAAYKLGTNYLDYTIKAGTTIQTLSKDPNRLRQGHLFYTNYLKLDKNIYAGSGFAKTNIFNTNTMNFDKVFKNKIQAKVWQDMKIASDKSAQKIFSETYKSPEAKKVFEEVKRHYAEHPKDIDLDIKHFIENAEDGKMLDKWANSKMFYVSRPFQAKGKKLTFYEHFNREIMPLDDPQAIKITKVFTDALAKKGYAGVLDINDTKVSNLRGIRPTIITDTSKVNTANAVATQITQQEYDKTRNTAVRAMRTLNSLDEHPIAYAASSSIMALGMSYYAAALKDAQAAIHAPKKDKKTQ